MFLTNVQEARYYVLMTIKSFYNEKNMILNVFYYNLGL